MPERVEEEIRQSLREAHPKWSEDKVNEMTYRTMNKKGLLKRKHGRRKRRDV